MRGWLLLALLLLSMLGVRPEGPTQDEKKVVPVLYAPIFDLNSNGVDVFPCEESCSPQIGERINIDEPHNIAIVPNRNSHTLLRIGLWQWNELDWYQSNVRSKGDAFDKCYIARNSVDTFCVSQTTNDNGESVLAIYRFDTTTMFVKPRVASFMIDSPFSQIRLHQSTSKDQSFFFSTC